MISSSLFESEESVSWFALVHSRETNVMLPFAESFYGSIIFHQTPVMLKCFQLSNSLWVCVYEACFVKGQIHPSSPNGHPFTGSDNS